jgi:hypothetical protein
MSARAGNDLFTQVLLALNLAQLKTYAFAQTLFL